jgi:hypothetical protein
VNGGREGLMQRFRKWIEGAWNEWQQNLRERDVGWEERRDIR